MAKISKLELLTEFGFSKDPFKKFTMKSSDNTRISKVVNMAVNSRAMVSVVGERGIGKSRAVRASLRKIQNVNLVYPLSNDINKLLISDIEQALIFDLSNEKPKRGREIRARQLRRIIGEASTRKEIVLVIEEAHHLHGMTLRALKRLREMDWMGETELFSIVLICQSDPMNKPGISEVRLRSDSINMRGLLQDEIVQFVCKTVGNVFAESAIEIIRDLPNSHNFEDLKNILFQLMASALFAGRRQVLEEDVDNIFGINNLEERRKKAGVSKADLAKISGIPHRTVSTLLGSDSNKRLSPADKEKQSVLGGFLKQLEEEKKEDSLQAAMG